jgi:hypothetical protein
MNTIKAKICYTENDSNKPYLKLNNPHTNSDGSIVKEILPENVGLLKGEILMDTPIFYYKLNSYYLKILEKNDFNCQLELDNLGDIRKIDDLVVILI